MKISFYTLLLSVAVSSATTVAGLAVWTWTIQPKLLNQAWLPVTEVATTTPSSELKIEPVADSSQTATLAASLTAALARLEKIEATLSSQLLTKATQQTKIVTSTTFDDQVIYLGTATTTSRDWKETGVEVTLNSSSYPEKVRASFEAGVSIVGGEVGARLKNKATGAIIAASELQAGGSSTTWKSSPSFSLFPGSATYVVELRSTSGETAYLQGSRLIIRSN